MSKQEEICDASSKGKTERVRSLLKRTLFRKGVDVNSKNSCGETPILCAAIYGHFQIVDLLIKHGADLNIQRKYDWMTPLMCAAKNGYFDVIQLLIESEAKINMIDKEEKTALYHAIESRNIRIFELLFSKGAYDSLNEEKKRDLLIHIFYKNFIEGAKFLLLKWNILNYDDTFKEELISLTVESGNFQMTELLLKHQTNVNTKNKDGKSILEIAVNNGHTKIVELLISNGVDINLKDSIQYSSLHWAIETKKLKIAKLLINAGAEVNTINYKKETPLMSAWQKDLSEIVILLIIKGAHGNIKVNSSDYLLNYALYSNKFEIAEILIENSVDINIKNDDGKFPLLCSLKRPWDKDYEKAIRIFKLIISKGANIDAVTNEGQSILSYTLQRGYDIESKLLISNGADVHFKDTKGKTPFDYAIESSYDEPDVIELLLSKGGGDISKENIDVFLKNAVFSGKTELASLFVKMGANTISFINTVLKNGNTPLIKAAYESEINTVEWLINLGADVNVKNENNGNSPLHVTCEMTEEDRVKKMLNDEIREANYDAIRREPIGSPSYYDELERRFSYYQVDKKEKDKRLKIAEILIMNGADVSSINNDGFTPKQLAQRNGQLKMIEFIEGLIAESPK